MPSAPRWLPLTADRNLWQELFSATVADLADVLAMTKGALEALDRGTGGVEHLLDAARALVAMLDKPPHEKIKSGEPGGGTTP